MNRRYNNAMVLNLTEAQVMSIIQSELMAEAIKSVPNRMMMNEIFGFGKKDVGEQISNNMSKDSVYAYDIDPEVQKKINELVVKANDSFRANQQNICKSNSEAVEYEFNMLKSKNKQSAFNLAYENNGVYLTPFDMIKQIDGLRKNNLKYETAQKMLEQCVKNAKIEEQFVNAFLKANKAKYGVELEDIIRLGTRVKYVKGECIDEKGNIKNVGGAGSTDRVSVGMANGKVVVNVDSAKNLLKTMTKIGLGTLLVAGLMCTVGFDFMYHAGNAIESVKMGTENSISKKAIQNIQNCSSNQQSTSRTYSKETEDVINNSDVLKLLANAGCDEGSIKSIKSYMDNNHKIPVDNLKRKVLLGFSFKDFNEYAEQGKIGIYHSGFYLLSYLK